MRPGTLRTLDVTVLPTMADVDELLRRIAQQRSDGARYAGFFAIMAYAGLVRRRRLRFVWPTWISRRGAGAVPGCGTRCQPLVVVTPARGGHGRGRHSSTGPTM